MCQKFSIDSDLNGGLFPKDHGKSNFETWCWDNLAVDSKLWVKSSALDYTKISSAEFNLVLKLYLCSKIDYQGLNTFFVNSFVVQFQIGLWSAKLYF